MPPVKTLCFLCISQQPYFLLRRPEVGLASFDFVEYFQYIGYFGDCEYLDFVDITNILDIVDILDIRIYWILEYTDILEFVNCEEYDECVEFMGRAGYNAPYILNLLDTLGAQDIPMRRMICNRN